MPRKLKRFQGRGIDSAKGERLYIAAYSRADACRMLAQQVRARSISCWKREMKRYFSEYWGDAMSGITPVRGVWRTREGGDPECLYRDPLYELPEKESRVCRTCVFAKWERTKTGRVRKSVSGRCVAEMVRVQFPVCADPLIKKVVEEGTVPRVAIWWDSSEECPCWKKTED